MNSDFKDLLSIFNETGVRYLVIGGYAIAEHVEPRFTKDLDIWLDNSQGNARLVIVALREFGAPLLDVNEADFEIPTTVYQMGLPPSRIDLLAGLTEMDFADCWNRRKVVEMGELSINYISAEDLLLNKVRVGRPQDLIDADNLRKKLNKN
jgi:hypothetical protein